VPVLYREYKYKPVIKITKKFKNKNQLNLIGKLFGNRQLNYVFIRAYSIHLEKPLGLAYYKKFAPNIFKK
jgi:hypothetical protein